MSMRLRPHHGMCIRFYEGKTARRLPTTWAA